MQQTLLRLPRAVPLGKRQLPWPRRYTTHSPFRVHDHLLCTDNTRTGMIQQIAADMTAVLQYFACPTICYSGSKKCPNVCMFFTKVDNP